MAVLSNGRRCPNAAIEGSTYCGLPQHQALSRFDTNQIAVLGAVTETEAEILADPDADQGQVDEIVERAESEFVEETPDEGSEAEAAGPVAEDDPSSTQAAGDVPPSTPPADEASEPEGQSADESGNELAAEQPRDGAVAAESDGAEETEQAEPVAEEAEQA